MRECILPAARRVPRIPEVPMAARILNFTDSERIIRAGQNDRRMYIILSGSVQISLRDGVDSFVVATMNKGDFFGEMSLFCNRPRTADAIAQGDVKLTYIESLQELKKFLSVNPNFAIKMVEVLSERLTKTDEHLIGVISDINRLKLEYEN
jgi:CRP-like cAMP-binding protein